jgi:hypothetical protein
LRFFSSHVGVAVVNLLDEPRCHELVAVAEEGSLGRATRIEPLPGGHAVFEHLQGALVGLELSHIATLGAERRATKGERHYFAQSAIAGLLETELERPYAVGGEVPLYLLRDVHGVALAARTTLGIAFLRGVVEDQRRDFERRRSERVEPLADVRAVVLV